MQTLTKERLCHYKDKIDEGKKQCCRKRITSKRQKIQLKKIKNINLSAFTGKPQNTQSNCRTIPPNHTELGEIINFCCFKP